MIKLARENTMEIFPKGFTLVWVGNLASLLSELDKWYVLLNTSAISIAYSVNTFTEDENNILLFVANEYIDWPHYREFETYKYLDLAPIVSKPNYDDTPF